MVVALILSGITAGLWVVGIVWSAVVAERIKKERRANKEKA